MSHRCLENLYCADLCCLDVLLYLFGTVFIGIYLVEHLIFCGVASWGKLAVLLKMKNCIVEISRLGIANFKLLKVTVLAD